MHNKTIAILESRLGESIAHLVRKHGGIPFSAPALAEIPDIDPAYIAELLHQWDTAPPDIFIFQTGVGVQALFSATDALNLTNQLLAQLEAAQVVVRGPKPTAALRSRKVRIDGSAKDPYTTAEVLSELDRMPLQGKRVLQGKLVAVQRYGETNQGLQKALEERGAQVIEIATYRWSLPENIAPLIDLMDALERDQIDAIAFTSASQAINLFSVAQQAGRLQALQDGLSQTLVASIGPVCTAALQKLGVRVDIEPHPPKLGPFIDALKHKLSGS